MTKVLLTAKGWRIAAAIWLAVCALPVAAAENPPPKPAEALYLQLGHVGLDPARVYKVRGASIERSAIHISLEDGTIGFTQDVMGRITGAFFEGDGEVLMTPQIAVERRSLSLFTGMAILEEHFATGYFRFNDDMAGELIQICAHRKIRRSSSHAGEMRRRTWRRRCHEAAGDLQPIATGDRLFAKSEPAN